MAHTEKCIKHKCSLRRLCINSDTLNLATSLCIYIYIALKTLPLNDKQQTRRKYLTELIDVYETST